MKIPPISICSRREASLRLYAEPGKYEYVVSIGSPGDDLPEYYEEFEGQKARFEFDDVKNHPINIKAGYIPPTINDMKDIIEFLQIVDGPVLIHCAAGISRSSATALTLITMKMGEGYEQAAVHYLITLKDKSPDIFPNESMIQYADRLLGREGRLEAIYRHIFF